MRVCQILFFLSVSLCLCGSLSYAQEQITVAVASSFYQQAKVYSTQFEAKHDVEIKLVLGSTGRLYNQIIQGAPFDVFVAADDVRPELLLKQGKAIAKYTVGLGYLGLIVHDKFVRDTVPLMNPSIQHIAIANPDVAPFGLATKKILQKQGLWEALKPKFVYAQNALQARMLVQKGLVDAGFLPVDKQYALASVPYVAVLLSDAVMASDFYNTLTTYISVTPAQAGTQILQGSVSSMDSRLRGNDGQ